MHHPMNGIHATKQQLCSARQLTLCLPAVPAPSLLPADLDPVNRKLLTHKFPKSGAMKEKRPPALLCGPGASNAGLWQSHMNHMLAPLRGWSGMGF
jgi:hypothetical protein